jgi:hypothetical protein
MKQFLGISLVIAAICGPSLLALQQRSQCAQSRLPETQNTIALFALGACSSETSQVMECTENCQTQTKVQQLLIESEGWYPIGYEPEGSKFRDPPSHLTYDRIHGGIE